VLAKTGLRVGELVHLMIEDVDLEGGWLHVRCTPELWETKTRRERQVPLLVELIAVFRRVIRDRTAGLVFRRQLFQGGRSSPAGADRQRLMRLFRIRVTEAETDRDQTLSREQTARIARGIWHDAGAVRADAIRNSFIQLAQIIGLADVTCPKSWRHTFATLLQDAYVDPLVRQLTLGHQPAIGTGALGMTAQYTHTRGATQRRQILAALQEWPESLAFATSWSSGDRIAWPW
jgi:integrase